MKVSLSGNVFAVPMRRSSEAKGLILAADRVGLGIAESLIEMKAECELREQLAYVT